MFRPWPSFGDDASPSMAGILVVLGGAGVGAYFLVDSLGGDSEKQPAPAPSIVIPESRRRRRRTRVPRLRDQEHHPRRRPRHRRQSRRRRPRRVPLVRGRQGPRRGQPGRGRRLGGRDRRGQPGGAAHPCSDPVHRQRTHPRRHRGGAERARPHRVREDGRKADLHDRVGERSDAIFEARAHHRVNSRGDRRRDRPAAPEVDRRSPATHRARELEQPAFAMPAAALGGAIGRAVLFVNEGCGAEADARPRSAANGRVPVYVLGPPSVISGKALASRCERWRPGRSGPAPRRISVENAIDFRATRAAASAGTSTTPDTDSWIARAGQAAGRRRPPRRCPPAARVGDAAAHR